MEGAVGTAGPGLGLQGISQSLTLLTSARPLVEVPDLQFSRENLESKGARGETHLWTGAGGDRWMKRRDHEAAHGRRGVPKCGLASLACRCSDTHEMPTVSLELAPFHESKGQF